MKINKVTDNLAVSSQITVDDIKTIKAEGFKSIICNRPDGEAADQPTFKEIENACNEQGISVHYLPIIGSAPLQYEDAHKFKELFHNLQTPVLAYCRTGTRSISIWAMAHQDDIEPNELISIGKNAGYDLSRIVGRSDSKNNNPNLSFDIVIVGGGSAGIAVASSLLKRKGDLKIAIFDPADYHYYQPGWTLVGAGIFNREITQKQMGSLIPKNVRWFKNAVASFEPENNTISVEGCGIVKYEYLIVCPGLKLNWAGVEGLQETLGKNGVTSNYLYDLAPYTHQLVQNLKGGNAIFTQPPMPIKCAGAPQKAMYLSSDYWYKNDLLKDIKVQFFTATPGLFGVADYVPALMEYVDKYDINLNFTHNLVKIDGENKKAYFKKVGEGASDELIEQDFDMIHICPPQCSPDFIKNSPLADAAGWVDVDQSTLRHKKYENIYSLGDVMNAPNAKTAAAARVQAPIVAINLLNSMNSQNEKAAYNGYGSCPLTVEKGKIVLAEFGYGGKILNTFPTWFLNGKRPTRLAWLLKERIMPQLYWQGMLKGREILVKPETTES